MRTSIRPRARGSRETLDAVRRRVAVVPAAPFNRMPASFAHIFAGGYAAGYYSYKWAEVLAADAFEAFEEAGVFDSATAARFLDSILARGGSLDAMEAFVRFRGRQPGRAAAAQANRHRRVRALRRNRVARDGDAAGVRERAGGDRLRQR